MQRHLWQRIQDQDQGVPRAFHPQQVTTKEYLFNPLWFLVFRVCDIRLTQKMDCREKTCWSPDYYDEDTPVALTMLESEYDNENPKLLEPSEEYCKVQLYSS